jgi:hypothetical protein
MKVCSSCKVLKEVDEFHKSVRYGLNSRCKPCNSEHAKTRFANRKAAGICLSCTKPVIKGKRFCLDHLIRDIYTTSHNKGKRLNRQAPWPLIKPWLPLVIEKWYDQGGNELGEGATCLSTGKPLSFIKATASIGHIRPCSVLQNLDFAHPTNIQWEHLGHNLAKMGRIVGSKPLEISEKFATLATGSNRLNPGLGKLYGVQLRSIWLSQPLWLCPYYGEPLTLETMSLDHIIPRSQGGLNTLDNTWFISRLANHNKHHQAHSDFCTFLDLPYFTPTPLTTYL